MDAYRCANCGAWFEGRGWWPKCPSCGRRARASYKLQRGAFSARASEAKTPDHGVAHSVHCPYCFWLYQPTRDSPYCPACGRSRFDGHKQEEFVSEIPDLYEALSKALAPLTYTEGQPWPNRTAERMPPAQIAVLVITILASLVLLLQATSGFLGAIIGLLILAGVIYWFLGAARRQPPSRSSSAFQPGEQATSLEEPDWSSMANPGGEGVQGQGSLAVFDAAPRESGPNPEGLAAAFPAPPRSGRSPQEVQAFMRRWLPWVCGGWIVLTFIAASINPLFFQYLLAILLVLAGLFFLVFTYWYWWSPQRTTSLDTACVSGGGEPAKSPSAWETAATTAPKAEGFHWGKCLSAVVILVSGAGLVWLGFRSDILAVGVSGGGLVALGCSGAIFSSFWRRYDGLPWYQRATIVAPKAILMIIYYLARNRHGSRYDFRLGSPW